MTVGDPHPGAIIGCMPFQSFNPSIDASRKNLNEAAAKPVSATSSGSQSGISLRENGSLMDEAWCSNTDKLSFDANGALKRKKKNRRGEKLEWNVLRPPSQNNR
ncbi:hypothetical protein ACB092_08G059900 [Castanea dentata]